MQAYQQFQSWFYLLIFLFLVLLIVFLECILKSKTTRVAAQETSKDFWKLILLPTLELWRKFLNPG